MNPTSSCSNDNADGTSSAAPTSSPPGTSRLARFFETFFRYAGAIAVDHTHMMPLDRVSGRTGIVQPRAPHRGCC